MEQKKKKTINFQTKILLRVSNDEHKIISEFAKENNTTISKILRTYINTLSK